MASKVHLPDAPPVISLETNLSGVLVNSMESFQYPRLYPETMVNVGGMHIVNRSDLDKSLPRVRAWSTSNLQI